MKSLNWKAVFAALGVFMVGGGATEVLLERAFGLSFRQEPTQGLPFVVCVVFPLIVFALLAGYVAASYESRRPMLNVVLFLVVYTSLNIILTRYNVSHRHHLHHPMWQRWSSWALFFGLPFLGAHIRLRRQPKPLKTFPEVLPPPIPLP